MLACPRSPADGQAALGQRLGGTPSGREGQIPARGAAAFLGLRCCALLLASVLAVSPPARADDPPGCPGRPIDDPTIAAAWRTLRVVDCARCHGKDYDGLAAPSIVDSVRTQSRDRFVRMVLDGDPPRGMPAYRNNALVAEKVDDLYRYFLARATEVIDAGARPAAMKPTPTIADSARQGSSESLLCRR